VIFSFSIYRFSFRLDFLQRSNTHNGLTASIHSDVPTLSYASDMRVLMENMQALNINHRQDDLLLSHSNPLKDSGYQGRKYAEENSYIFLKFIFFRFTFKFKSTLYTTSVSFKSITKQCHRNVRCMYLLKIKEEISGK
jgi:hypothetical protein